MADEGRDDKKTETDRRDFLSKVGRIAVYTPPTVSVVLSVADKARADDLNTSYDTPTTTISTTISTIAISTTISTITSTATIVTVTDALLQSDPSQGSNQESKLASIVDSMGVMKNS